MESDRKQARQLLKVGSRWRYPPSASLRLWPRSAAGWLDLCVQGALQPALPGRPLGLPGPLLRPQLPSKSRVLRACPYIFAYIFAAAHTFVQDSCDYLARALELDPSDTTAGAKLEEARGWLEYLRASRVAG